MRSAIEYPRAVAAASLAFAAGLAGCDGAGSRGRAILGDLRRDGVPLPPDTDASGAAPADNGIEETARADLPAAGPVTLEDLLRVAEARNPALAAARSRAGMAAAGAWQAALYPSPRLDVSVEEVPVDGGLPESTATVGITQPIVLGGRLRAAEDAAEAERAARLAEAKVRTREVFGDIAGLHARLVSIRNADRLYAELHLLATRTLETAQIRFDARAAPETEVIRPRIELHRIEQARARLAKDRDSAAEQLKQLLGGTAIDPDRLAEPGGAPPEQISFGSLAAAVRREHPGLAAADREIDAAAARLARARAEQTPDLELRLAAGYKGETDEAIVEAGAGITLPLGARRRSEILAARFDLMRARQERRAAEGDLLARLAESHGEYESARAQIEAVRDRIVPAAQRAFDQTRDAYRAGHAPFLDLLEAQRTLVEARVALVELTGDAGAARARIARIAGPEGLGAERGTGASDGLITEPDRERRDGAGESP